METEFPPIPVRKARPHVPENRTSIYTAPTTETGKLLRQAASFMPTVRVGERGWILTVILRALVYYIDQHSPTPTSEAK